MKEQKEIALNIVKTLRKAGFEALWAGGCVRDLLMRKEPHDIDIATSAHPETIERIFPKTIPVGKQFGVILVEEEGGMFEVATFRTEGEYRDGRRPESVTFANPERDALRRDFTVNALFYDPIEKKIMDFVDGERDVWAKVIRAVGSPYARFEEDKLRILRAVRFAANLDFTIEPETWRAVRELAHKIHQVSQERLREELMKIFTRPNAGKGLLLLDESGLLQEILPEISAMKGVEQSPEYHPEGDVFIHTKLLLDKLEKPDPVLAFSALLHDVGKPRAVTRDERGVHFYEHEKIGAVMSQEMLRRLRFSNKEIDEVSACVANHMKFAHVREMREGKLKRFMASPTFSTEMELHRIDCLSSHGKLDNYHFLQKKISEIPEEDLKPKPLVSGHDLIKIGFKSGPEMGKILTALYDAQLEGTITTYDEALEWAKKNKNKSDSH
ncbi:MAG: CCA tRNA nucleotidyltransferase [Candidatus Omnitrophica bacterium]|nr:CCA tRNA nucleotidyltransferase [Candidatus Omnitrophota bacterium]